MSEDVVSDAQWTRLTSFSDTFTCYSSALATWVAGEHERWERVVNPGLYLSVTEAGAGRFAFGHFPAGLRQTLGLSRTGADDPAAAVEGVLAELGRSGRVIVAGDGYRLPWHVAFERRHVPHWFVIVGGPAGAAVVDPFACRNDLGVQSAHTALVEPERLAALLSALPHDDPVLMLRESLAFGDEARGPDTRGHQWFVRGEVGEWRAPAGAEGPQAILRLARHFAESAQLPQAYAQADDLWSIARHRAFLARYAREVAGRKGSQALAAWVSEHAEPLAKRWGHIAPLIMQATLALSAGRAASASVFDTLEALAGLELAAGEAFPATAEGSSPASLEVE